MTENEIYQQWLENATADPELIPELKKMDKDTINDAFYRTLEFGTGGLRGVIGAGTNRMNYYVVSRATQGLSDWLLASDNPKSVAISYDSRINSIYFAKAAADVLVANGIKVHFYKELSPTPMLSFAVRNLNCGAGIMVTASHNPAKYNGYKAYGPDGCQLTLDDAKIVLEKINSHSFFEDDIKHSDFEEGIKSGAISYIGEDTIDEYFKNVHAQRINTGIIDKSDLKVVYTPLNGTGNKPVRRILSEIGVENVTVVPEQENPDGHFPTCPYPNPEFREALECGLKLCDKIHPDLLLATDPDCDRMGIAVPDGNGDYELFTGNEVGALMLNYICEQRTKNGTMPKDPIAVKTIVTTDIVDKIAQKYNVHVIETLTGFKFIGEQIGILEKKHQENRYLFGFEESYGYLAGTYVRDKDAVVASELICEMAAYYKQHGMSLIDARENMYKEYGNYLHSQQSFEFDGESGLNRMNGIMSGLRKNPPKSVAGLKVLAVSDYLESETTDTQTGRLSPISLPKSNVLSFVLEKECKIIIRPSGTEPKIKAYYTAKSDSREKAKAIEDQLKKDFSALLLSE